MSKPILIGITGGTGSGKSTIADALYSNFSNDCIAMIQQDMYYNCLLYTSDAADDLLAV